MDNIGLVTSPRGGKYRLSDMELDFVSLVPAGDDPSAVVVIAKADPEGGKEREVSGASGSTLSSNSRHTEETMGQINKADLDPEVLAYVEAMEDEIDTLSAQVEKSEKDITERDEQIAKMVPANEESAEEIQKSLLEKADPAVRSLIEKQQKELAQMQEVAKAEREARLEKEYLSKAEELPMVAEDKPSLANLLRAAAEKLSEEENETLEKVLKSANEGLRQSGLFAEFGTGGGETTISKSVKSLSEEVKKSHPDWTDDQAMAHVYETNPDLFAQAMSEEG